jgi:predicted O-methyltransferase YrrM
MDDKVKAVLAAYHARMHDEEKARHKPTATGAGDWRDKALLAVGPDTGRLINTLARSLAAPTILELGTSYGYSGIWLAEAARATGGRLITMELADFKSNRAREMATQAGLAGHVDFKVGDAVQMISDLPMGVDFVLVDLWKDLYEPCLEAFYPKLNPGAKLPAEAITPIYRADSSGTTYNLTDYLSRISPEWKSKVGTGTSVDFPVGTGGKGSSGVSAALSRAEGGITYVDTAYSLQNGFAYAMLRNRAGNFTLPTTSAVAAAANAVSSIPADNAISIVDPPASAAAAYPLSTFTYAIVPEDSAKAACLADIATVRRHVGKNVEVKPVSTLD